jgi:hypothetical protein
VSLFANSQLVGTTTSAANGTWQIVTGAMEDGVYDVSAKVQSASGAILTRSWGALVVDTIAPETVVNGLVDGVAWTPQTVISGVIADPDSQLRVEYQINSDGTTAVSALMGATIVPEQNDPMPLKMPPTIRSLGCWKPSTISSGAIPAFTNSSIIPSSVRSSSIQTLSS